MNLKSYYKFTKNMYLLVIEKLKYNRLNIAQSSLCVSCGLTRGIVVATRGGRQNQSWLIKPAKWLGHGEDGKDNVIAYL